MRVLVAAELESLTAKLGPEWKFTDVTVKDKFFTALVNILSIQPELWRVLADFESPRWSTITAVSHILHWPPEKPGQVPAR